MNKGNTPTLTQSQEARAPWNDEKKPKIAFPVYVSETLTKRCDVETDEYKEEDNGKGEEPTLVLKGVDWNDAYKQSCFTLQELLSELTKYINAEMKAPTTNDARKGYLKKMLADCQGWDVEEICVDED